jgi:sulfur-carrier protein
VPGILQTFTGGRDRIVLDAEPATVGEALGALWRQHPGVRDRVVTEAGQVRPHVNVFLGETDIRYTEGLATAVPRTAEILILPAVSGG